MTLSLPDTFEVLESGTNSELLLSRDPTGSAHLVLKTVDVAHLRECGHLRNENEVLQRLHHPHIVRPLGFRKEVLLAGVRRSVLILPFAEHSSLLAIVKARKLLAAEVRELFGQVVQAVAHLHSSNLVHRDIKLQNILVFEEAGKAVVKLSDFGFAEESVKIDGSPRLFKSYKGTRRGYMAPQIHTVFDSEALGYDAAKADVFALGVLLFALLFKKLPFEFATKQNAIFRFISDSQMDKFFRHHGKEFARLEQQEHGMCAELKELLAGMLECAPERRLTIEEVSNHPWLKGETKQLVL